MNNDTLIKLTCRSIGTVGYTVPELHVTRNFQPKETKEIPFGELQALSWVPGGESLLLNDFIIGDKEALELLLPGVEPEYFYKEEDVKRIMLEGTLDEFLDMLDFAPEGVINLIESLAVTLELNDMNKREAILKKTGFNVTNAIKIENTGFDGGEAEEQKEETRTRRVSTGTTSGTAIPARRVTLPTKSAE